MTPEIVYRPARLTEDALTMPKKSEPEMRPGYPKHAGLALLMNLALIATAIYFLANQ